MTDDRLTAFREASARLAEHAADPRHFVPGATRCRCSRCVIDRETLDDNAPAVLTWIGLAESAPVGSSFAYLCNEGVARGVCRVIRIQIAHDGEFRWLRDESNYEFCEAVKSLGNRCLWRPVLCEVTP